MKSVQVWRTLGLCKGIAAWVAVVGLALAPAQVLAQWTQWGGPKQNFHAKSRGLAKDWPTEGPPKIWERELGDGYSAILVDKGKLYTMRRIDNKETVICLNAKDGKTVWEYKYDSAPKEGHAVQFGEGPRSTPLIDGDYIYAIGVASQMHCLDKKTGEVIWTRNLWDEFEGNVLPHGYSSSPIAYKKTIITLVGGKDAAIVAFNKSDGSVAWKNLSFENSYSTPKIMKVRGKDQLVTFMASEVIGADPTNGELKWQFAHGNQWKQNVCMPVLSKNTLFISSPEAGARGLKISRKGDDYSVEEVWSTRKIQFYHVSAVDQGGFVYASTGTMGPAFMAAIDIETGEIAWRKRGLAKANCVMADGRLIIVDEDGNLALATATPKTFKVHSKVKMLEKVSWTVPTVVGKKLYVRDKKNILALNIG